MLSLVQNTLGFQLLSELAQQAPRRNVCLSPFGLSMSLALLEGGANGNTRTNLNRLLGLTGLSEESRDPILRSHQDAVLALNPEALALSMSHILKFGTHLTARPPFLQRAAILQDVALLPEGTTPTLRLTSSLQVTARLMPASVAYHTGVFRSANGRRAVVPMQQLPANGQVRAMQSNGLVAVRIPCQNSNIVSSEPRHALYLFLPENRRKRLPETLRVLRDISWKTWTAPLRQQDSGLAASVLLPPLFQQSDLILNRGTSLPTLKPLLAQPCDFSRMTFTNGGTLMVDQFRHCVGLRIATAPPRFVAKHESHPMACQVTIDRPFVYALADEKTDTVLATGMTAMIEG